MYAYWYLQESGPQKFKAKVVNVLDRSFDVVLTELGLARRVLLEKDVRNSLIAISPIDNHRKEIALMSLLLLSLGSNI